MKILGLMSLSSAVATGVIALALPADADQVTVQRTTVVTPGVKKVVVQPVRVLTPVATETTTVKKTTVETTAPPVPVVSTRSFSSSTVSELSTAPHPAYCNRLSRMLDQVHTGVSRGWLSQAQADNLIREHDRIASMIGNRSNDTEACDRIESSLNSLNIAIQDDFRSHMQTAGLGYPY